SRYVRRRLPWPVCDDQEKINYLLRLCASHDLKGWVLIPTDDHSVGLLSNHHQALSSSYQVTVPPWETLRWACDKRLLYQLAERVQVHQPWTFCPSTREELATIDFPFPVILKPALRLRPSNLTVPKAWPAHDRKSLLKRYDEASALFSQENLIIQEMVPGGGDAQFSYAALCKDGHSLASVVARRTRQFPRDFGHFSTYVETIDAPEVIEPAERLLGAMRFTGLAEVEFKRYPRNAQFSVPDINPRVSGWHTPSPPEGTLAQLTRFFHSKHGRGPCLPAADIDPTYSSGVHRFLICGVNPIVARVRFAYGQRGNSR